MPDLRIAYDAEAESRRIADDLRQARSVEDLLAIEPHWIPGDR